RRDDRQRRPGGADRFCRPAAPEGARRAMELSRAASAVAVRAHRDLRCDPHQRSSAGAGCRSGAPRERRAGYRGSGPRGPAFGMTPSEELAEDHATIERIHREWWAANEGLDVAGMTAALAPDYLMWNLNGHPYRSRNEA